MSTSYFFGLWNALLLVVRAYFGLMIHGQEDCASNINTNIAGLFLCVISRPVITIGQHCDHQQQCETSHWQCDFCHVMMAWFINCICFLCFVILNVLLLHLIMDKYNMLWIIYYSRHTHTRPDVKELLNFSRYENMKIWLFFVWIWVSALLIFSWSKLSFWWCNITRSTATQALGVCFCILLFHNSSNGAPLTEKVLF